MIHVPLKEEWRKLRQVKEEINHKSYNCIIIQVKDRQMLLKEISIKLSYFQTFKHAWQQKTEIEMTIIFYQVKPNDVA